MQRLPPSRYGTESEFFTNQRSAVGGVGQRRFAATVAVGKQFADLVGAHGLAEIPALADLAAKRQNRFVSPLVLDPFDADRHRKGPRKRGNSANDCAILALGVDVSDEAAVDLDNVERQRTKVRQR